MQLEVIKLTIAQSRNLSRLATIGPVTRSGGQFRDLSGNAVRGLHAPTVRRLVALGLVSIVNNYYLVN